MTHMKDFVLHSHPKKIISHYEIMFIICTQHSKLNTSGLDNIHLAWPATKGPYICYLYSEIWE